MATDAKHGEHAPKTSNIAALDGLRGLAVIAVLIDHFSWSFTPKMPLLKDYLAAGWIGVDLFFCLSGYLITRGLVKDTGRTLGERLKLFWMRRALRIFPLYYIVVIVGTIVCLAVGARQHIPGLSYWLYFQNYHLAFDPDVLRWTAHFWSLAIEEQFYFVWPLVVLLSPKKARPWVAGTLFALCVGSRTFFALKPQLLLAHIPQVEGFGPWDTAARFLYRSTPTHMDGLLLGALLSMLETMKGSAALTLWRRWRGVIFAVSTAALIGLMAVTKGFLAEDRRVVIVGYPLLAVVFASAVSLAVDHEFIPTVQRLFTSRPLVACGKVSYGMYIFHWPAVALLAPKLDAFMAVQDKATGAAVGTAVIVVGTLLSYVVAQLSFKYVESWFLTLKERFHD